MAGKNERQRQAEQRRAPEPQHNESSSQAAADPRSLPTTINFQEDAGKGQEGVDRESVAIPFLAILQPGSPQVVNAVEGARPGLFANSVTNAFYDSPIIIPCAFQRRWVRWAARETGGGFKGEFTTVQANDMRAAGQVKELEGRLYFPESDGSINPKKSDRLSDTRSHFCIVLSSETDELGVPMVFALTSTGIKASKNLLARIDGITLRGADGQNFKPAAFSHMYRVSTEKKSNEKGTWWLPKIDMVGPVRSASVYAAAKNFHALVTAGKVDVAHETASNSDDAGGAADDRM